MIVSNWSEWDRRSQQQARVESREQAEREALLAEVQVPLATSLWQERPFSRWHFSSTIVDDFLHLASRTCRAKRGSEPDVLSFWCALTSLMRSRDSFAANCDANYFGTRCLPLGY